VFDGLSLQRYVASLVQNTHPICTDRNSRTCPRDHDRNAELFDHTCRFVGKKGSDSITSLADSSSERSFWRWTSAGIPTEGTDELLPEKTGCALPQRMGATRECCVCPMRCCRARKTRAFESSWGNAELSAGFLDGHLVVIRHRKCLSEQGAHFAEQFVDRRESFPLPRRPFPVGLCRGILSTQGVSLVSPESGKGSIRSGLRFRRIMKAALNTMRVNQVVSVTGP